MDGDGAAAMRYTEAKMSKIASEMLKDIEKETVSLQPNFDDSLEEPSVLPSTIPNLLMNGSEGIAVGMATKIPPHNLCEIVAGLTALLKTPEISVKVKQQHERNSCIGSGFREKYIRIFGFVQISCWIFVSCTHTHIKITYLYN